MVGPRSYRRGMPPRRQPPPPDLSRVARILDGRGDGATRDESFGGEEEGGPGTGRRPGWVPVLSSAERAAAAPRPREPDPSPTQRLEADLRRARRPDLVTAPEPLRVGRWWVGGPTVVAFIALVVAVAGFFAVRVLWAERDSRDGTSSTVTTTSGDPPPTGGSRVVVTGGGPTAATVPGASTGGAAPGGSASSTPPPAGGGATAGPPVQAAAAGATGVVLVVHVVGQVVRPGLVRLPPGSRVADAVAAAGGARSGADLAALNLARVVVDGEQLHVPRPGEVVPPAPGAGSGGSTGGGGSGGSGGGGTGGGAGGGAAAAVSLNTADLSALDSLPGVGPVLAQRILDWRAEHGRFTSVDELGEVSGIGDKLLAQLRPRVAL